MSSEQPLSTAILDHEAATQDPSIDQAQHGISRSNHEDSDSEVAESVVTANETQSIPRSPSTSSASTIKKEQTPIPHTPTSVPLPASSSSTTTDTTPSLKSKPPDTVHEHHGEIPSREVKNIETDVNASPPGASPEGAGDKEKEGQPDPYLVDFDGPDDPLNARNWSTRKKFSNIAVIASITFLTPLASSMLAPGVPALMSDFNSSSNTLSAFVVSVYVLGYVFGPIILAPLSELYGRLPLYHGSNVGFVIFTIACAVASNLESLIVFRFIEGVFGSCPLTIGGGTIADMIVQEKRGGVMAIWALGPLMGPVIGPIAGGYTTDALGWRWVFWIIAIVAGVFALLGLFSLQETYPVIILERKAARLRKSTGDDSYRSKLALPYTPSQLFKVSIVRPMKMLMFSPIVFFLSAYIALVYGYLYLLFTTLTPVFEKRYHFSSGSVGLTYLGIGVGALLGVIIFGALSDKLLAYLVRRDTQRGGSGESKPEYRLPPLIPGSFVIPAGLFIYGWTAENAERGVHWIAPIIGTSLVGFGMLATFMPIQMYLVDAFTVYAASALAANTILRSLVGALLPLCGLDMYDKLGLGWGNSLLGFVALVGPGISWALWRFGEGIRKKQSGRFEVSV